MSTTKIGRDAEDFVANYLSNSGYKIVAKNWRTRYCEIDIVATKATTVYFIEVKYRKSNSWGDGLDAITPKKLSQMKFSAEFWLANNNWNGQLSLAVASTEGDPIKLIDFIII